ncbi:sensor histidine kinase [Flavobacterium sp. 7A]|uniref:sensor histidine kinase n=1 Tax=Flavobacterium sp. 7A TaxID=2940571 RepID=UPI0022265154|nr:ATP-binding protein [Flavobacterium sp. 7A]MCW2121227.1 signal transduction histidine kinase [Flavobacterium sp. 7A]
MFLFSTKVKHVAYNYEPIMKNKGIVFENDVNSSIYAFVDSDSFKIILRNLVDNAIKFTPENGTIKVYSLPGKTGFVTLVVEDSGTGMPEEKRLELLRPTVLLSKKGKEEGVGTGLGMQLCKSLIERNGGEFAIESEVGVGTRILVSLLIAYDV